MRPALAIIAAGVALAACGAGDAEPSEPTDILPPPVGDQDVGGTTAGPGVAPRRAPDLDLSNPATATEPAVRTLPIPTGDGWQVVFLDGFAGEELDDAWNTCHWWQVDGGCTIASNGELEWYRPEAVEVADGVLRLTASADPQQTTDGGTLPYRSGMVTTGPTNSRDDSSSFAFTYGRVSVRAKVPLGAGTWPAVWLLSADKTSLPEIDVFEWYGGRPWLVTSHVHQRINGSRASERIESTVSDFAAGWHTFSMTWLPDLVVFEIDGVETGRVTDPLLVPSTPMYLVMNLAMGGQAGPVDESLLPHTFEIDEIVVSQRVGS